MHWSLMGVTKYLLKKCQILNGLMLFLRPFGLRQQKEKKVLPKACLLPQVEKTPGGEGGI